MDTKASRLLLLMAVGHASMLPAQPLGSFTATGNMTTVRSGHTATLLTDGRVLFAGGEVQRSDLYKTQSSAELYDPRTRTFTATGNMITPRRWHTATLVADGRVLIAGGDSYDSSGSAIPSGTQSSAELYDPRTGTFTATGNMTASRRWHTSTLLNDGKVLIAGGSYPGEGFCCFHAGAEIYDPGTGTFTATGSMVAQWADTATLLPNGKVFVTKGNPQTGPYLSSSELYDPSRGTFTFAGYAAANHTGPTATLMMDGKVLIAGGNAGDGDWSSNIAELYDPATGVFNRTGEMTLGREQHAATLLPGGNVLFTGGHLWRDLAASAEILDPIKGTFTRTANMVTPHQLHTATLLADGTVLIAGGYMPWPLMTSSAEIYRPEFPAPAPLLFSVSGDGRGQGAIVHANTARVASVDSPAAEGEALEIYLKGLGDGSLIPPQVSIGGRMAEVLWFGSTPGFTGLNQINVRVPAGVSPGSTIPVRLTYIGRPSNEVTIAVR